MIRIKAVTCGNTYCEVTSRGHADFAEEGSDIVCAAVSVLMINTANAIEKFTDDHLTEEEGDGFLSIKLRCPPSEKAALLMNTLVLGLHSVQETYGKQFLKLSFRNQK
jgi:hypothetical protein